MLVSRMSALRSAGKVASAVGIASYGAYHHTSSSLAEGTSHSTPAGGLVRHPTSLIVASTADIIVPTIEATVRVIRLVKTAALIAADYKMADWFRANQRNTGRRK